MKGPGSPKARAVITIYLSMMLLLILALICSLIESARIRVMESRLRSITYMAEDSCFADFAKSLFEDYGVMGYWGNDSDFMRLFEKYAEENLSADALSSLIFCELYGESPESARLSSVTHLTDDNGSVFREQVLEYMNYYLIEDAVQRILDNVSIFSEGDKVDAFMEKIEGYSDTFKKVEDQVGKIQDKINNVKSIATNPSSLLDDLSYYIEDYKNGNEDAAYSFRSTVNKLKWTDWRLTSSLEDVQDATDRYYDYVSDARDAVSELENSLELDKDDFSEDVYDAVNEQLTDIRQKSADTDFDYFLVGQNQSITDSYISRLDSLSDLYSSVSEPLSDENSDDYEALIDSYRNEFSDFDVSQLELNFAAEETEKEDDSFLDSISDLFESGILGFVAGDVSDKTLDTSELPSRTCGENASSSEENLLEASANKAIFGEYILTHFGNFTETNDDAALDYETEYIIAGKESDEDNLATVVGEIVLIRSGCNLISLLKSSSKKLETSALATSIAGCTGMPIVIKIVQILIMTVWALAESIADVKALLDGHKVKTIKDDDDWYVSISGLKNFTESSVTSSGTERGLSYQAYLRLLLLMQNRDTQCLRTMDMIQANLCLNEDDSFRLSDCITSVSVCATYKAPQLFAALPFVSSIGSIQSGQYVFEVEQAFSY